MSLVLGRTVGERVRLRYADGPDVWVTVARIVRGEVKLAFDAPMDVQIAREEVIDKDDQIPTAWGLVDREQQP